MAGKFCELGQLVREQPAAAYKKLADLYQAHQTRRGVARALQVNEGTVGRWLQRLREVGAGDPRVDSIEK